MKDLAWLKEQVNDYLDIEGVEDARMALKAVLGYIDQLDEPEVLSLDWIDDNKKYSSVHSIGYYVPIGKLHDLLVPKQDEVDRAYEDGYEKGKQYATEKQSEETETVAGVFVDYLIASAKLKLVLKMEVEELEE